MTRVFLLGVLIAVFITDGGVTIVDAKLPGFGPTIVERVKSVTNKPITRIINTHTHNDHTGSNEFFGASIENIVQENTKANMAKMDEFKGLADFAAFAEKGMKAGKTSEQAAGEYKLDPKYKGYVVSVNPAFGGARANMDIAYNELKK